MKILKNQTVVVLNNMKIDKKADLSINVIIVAAIALIVLVVLVAVFTGRFGIFSKAIKQTGDPSEDCEEQGFVEKDDVRCPEGSSIALGKVRTSGNICCTK